MRDSIYEGSKVPEITAAFWTAKILTTAMGEAASDYLVFHFNPQLAVLSCVAVLAAALVLQFMCKVYRPWAYWLVVAMIGIVGTMVADVIHVVLGIPYDISTPMFAVALATVLFLWWRYEGTLSIHSVQTPRREAFYWATVIATFALGTAAGDLSASTLHLGYLGSAVMFTILFAVPGLCYWRLRWNEIAMFWTAYILTRPMGASFADWFDKPQHISGLSYGDGPVAAVLILGVVIVVTYIALSHARQSKAAYQIA